MFQLLNQFFIRNSALVFLMVIKFPTKFYDLIIDRNLCLNCLSKMICYLINYLLKMQFKMNLLGYLFSVRKTNYFKALFLFIFARFLQITNIKMLGSFCYLVFKCLNSYLQKCSLFLFFVKMFLMFWIQKDQI